MATQINLDNATRVDITCRRGDTFKIEFTFTDDDGDAIDLTSYSWKMDVKETDTSSGDIIGDSSLLILVIQMVNLQLQQQLLQWLVSLVVYMFLTYSQLTAEQLKLGFTDSLK